MSVLINEGRRREAFADAWSILPEQLKEQCQPIYEEVLKTRDTIKLLPSCDDSNCWSFARHPEDSDDRRVKSRFGRIVRKQFNLGPEIIADQILGQLTNRLNASIWKDVEVKRLYGSQITESYSEDLVGSCMSGESSEYVELYAINPDKVSLLVVQNENAQTVARALLWIDDNDTLVLDRVYGSMNNAQAIVSHAEALGAITRPDIYSCNLPQYSGTVTLKDPEAFYPYTDTFRYATRIADGMLKLSTDNGECRLESTEGYAGSCCDDCNCSTWSDDNLCESCRENYVYCEICDCRIYGENSHYIGSCGYDVCQHCLSEHFTTCSECGEYTPNDDLCHINNRAPICIHCMQADSDIVTCSVCNEYFDRNLENITEHNGEYYCEQHTTIEMLAGKEEAICA